MDHMDSAAKLSFETLEAWQESRVVVRGIYQVTRLSDVRHDYALCSQIRRAGVSIMSNIAEGFERTHLSEKLQFYNIARGSAAEVRSLLYVIQDNYPNAISGIPPLRDEVMATGRLISGLIRSTERRKQLRKLALGLPILVALLL